MSDGGWERVGFRQDRWAWVGGALAFFAVASIRILIGRLYGEAEVVRFLEGIEAPALFFASALATSSTTILALMLTLLSFVHQLDADFDDEFFQRIYRIGLYTAIREVEWLIEDIRANGAAATAAEAARRPLPEFSGERHEPDAVAARR